MVGSPGTGGRWGPAQSACLVASKEASGAEEEEVEGIEVLACSSTVSSSETPGPSLPAPTLSGGPGEVEEDRDVVEEVEDDEE